MGDRKGFVQVSSNTSLFSINLYIYVYNAMIRPDLSRMSGLMVCWESAHAAKAYCLLAAHTNAVNVAHVRHGQPTTVV